MALDPRPTLKVCWWRAITTQIKQGILPSSGPNITGPQPCKLVRTSKIFRISLHLLHTTPPSFLQKESCKLIPMIAFKFDANCVVEIYGVGFMVFLKISKYYK